MELFWWGSLKTEVSDPAAPSGFYVCSGVRNVAGLGQSGDRPEMEVVAILANGHNNEGLGTWSDASRWGTEVGGTPVSWLDAAELPG